MMLGRGDAFAEESAEQAVGDIGIPGAAIQRFSGIIEGNVTPIGLVPGPDVARRISDDVTTSTRVRGSRHR